MTSKERMLTTVSYKKTDRLPIIHSGVDTID